jgi:hypothetical protein
MGVDAEDKRWAVCSGGRRDLVSGLVAGVAGGPRGEGAEHDSDGEVTHGDLLSGMYVGWRVAFA